MTGDGRGGGDRSGGGSDDGRTAAVDVAPVVVLLSRDRCHLCDRARDVVRQVCAEAAVDWTEVDVDSAASRRSGVHDRWTDLVPVVTVGGRLLAHYRVEAEDLADALADHRDG